MLNRVQHDKLDKPESISDLKKNVILNLFQNLNFFQPEKPEKQDKPDKPESISDFEFRI